MRLVNRIAGRLAAAVLLAGLAAPTDAANTLTLDVPNAVVARPTSAPVFYTFTGTIHLDPGVSWTGGEAISSPFLTAGGTRLNASLLDDITLPTGGTYSGALFAVLINPTSELGLYGVDFDGAPPTYEISLRGATGAPITLSATYSVLVTAAVPEPSAWVSASLAAFAAAGLGGRRLARRRAAG